MLDTYRSDSATIAARQVEVANYAVLAEITILGWEIEIAESKGRPMILFRAAEWDGRQPRFAVTATELSEFRNVMHDLVKLPYKLRDQLATVGYDEPVWISGGLPPIPKSEPELIKNWAKLGGDPVGI